MCKGRINQRWWGPSSQTAEQLKTLLELFFPKTYGTDRDESVSVLNHSDKLNDFPSSTERVSVLFLENRLEFLSKSLQQRSVWKWSASFEMKGDGGYSECTSLLEKLMQTICYYTDLLFSIWQRRNHEWYWCLLLQTVRVTDRFSLLCSLHEPIPSFTSLFCLKLQQFFI